MRMSTILVEHVSMQTITNQNSKLTTAKTDGKSICIHLNQITNKLTWSNSLNIFGKLFLTLSFHLFVQPPGLLHYQLRQNWDTKVISGPLSSNLVDKDVSYHVDDESPIQAPSLQLALPLPFQEAEDVLCVKLQEFIQNWEQFLHRLQLQLQLLLQAFAVYF